MGYCVWKPAGNTDRYVDAFLFFVLTKLVSDFDAHAALLLNAHQFAMSISGV